MVEDVRGFTVFWKVSPRGMKHLNEKHIFVSSDFSPQIKVHLIRHVRVPSFFSTIWSRQLNLKMLRFFTILYFKTPSSDHLHQCFRILKGWEMTYNRCGIWIEKTFIGPCNFFCWTCVVRCWCVLPFNLPHVCQAGTIKAGSSLYTSCSDQTLGVVSEINQKCIWI